MITLLNAPILTSFGTYEYRSIEVEQAKELVAIGFQSFIGHESTADILSRLLDIKVPHNRAAYVQQVGEEALIFQLKSRILAGTVLQTAEEIENVGYQFGVLKRIQ